MSVTAPEFDEVWQWDGWTTFDESPYNGAVDSDGNIIMVGSQGREVEYYDDTTFVNAESGDFAAVKLSSSGEVLWTWVASSSDGQADSFDAVDTDSNNDVIIGGSTHGYWDQSNPNDVPHVAVVKLSASGDELWRYQESPLDLTSSTLFGEIYYGKGSVFGVAVDGDDNIFLAGQIIGALVPGEGSNQDSDSYVTKLDGTNGSEMWTIQLGDSSSFDVLQQVKVASAGDVIAVGFKGVEGASNFHVLKLSGLDGSIIWEYAPVTSFTIDIASSVDVDTQDDVYVCGAYDAQNLQGDIAETPVVLKLDGATGDVIWTYEGVATSRATFYSVAVDPVTGWIVGAGQTEGTWVTGAAAGGFDFAAVLLDGDGVELSRYQGGTVEDDSLSFAGFDSAGALFLGGSGLNDGQEDFFAIKFAPFESAASTLPPSPAPMDATPAPSASATLPPISPSPVGDNASPAPARTPAPSSVGRGGVPTLAPSPAPTSAVAAAAVLAEWEIGAIAGGGAFLLLLLGLCKYPPRTCSLVKSLALRPPFTVEFGNGRQSVHRR